MEKKILKLLNTSKIIKKQILLISAGFIKKKIHKFLGKGGGVLFQKKKVFESS